MSRFVGVYYYYESVICHIGGNRKGLFPFSIETDDHSSHANLMYQAFKKRGKELFCKLGKMHEEIWDHEGLIPYIINNCERKEREWLL